MIQGESQDITAEVVPSNADNQGLTVTSLDTTVANVTKTRKRAMQTYNVTGLKVGTTKIKVASVEDPTIFKEINVTVNPKLPDSIAVNIPVVNMKVGEGANITVTTLPTDATHNIEMTQNNQNATIAKQNTVGNVDTWRITGAVTGQTVFTFKCTDKPSLTATCTVNVTNPPTSITTDKQSVTATIGSTVELGATVNPTNADNITIVVEGKNDAVATITQGIKLGSTTKYAVVGVSAGTFTVTFKCGTATKTVPITITSPAAVV